MRTSTPLLVLFFLSISVISKGQSFAWAKSIGGINTDHVDCETVDATGNIYAGGGFAGTVDFDPGPGVTNMTANPFTGTMFLIKLDAAGNLVWARSFNSAGVLCMTTDGAGGLFLAGEYSGTVDFDPGPGVHNLSTATNSANGYILKLDTAGNFAWVNGVSGSGSTPMRPTGIKADIGKVVVTGYYTGTTDFDPGPATFYLTSPAIYSFILKLDNLGDFIWAKQIAGSGPSAPLGKAQARSIAINSTNDIYISGDFSGTVDFDPGNGTFNLVTYANPPSAVDVGAFIVKLDSTGAFYWAKAMSGGNSGASAYSVAVDGSNNVYLTGGFSGTIDFDPGTTVANLTTINNYSDGYVQKLDALGNLVWIRQIEGWGGVTGYSILLDANSNVWTGGIFSGGNDFDPGPAVINRTSSGGLDVYLLQLDNSGNFLSISTVGGSASEAFRGLSADAAGGIYTAGTYSGSVDFNPGSGVYNLTSNGQDDDFILKLGLCSSAPAQPTAINGNSIACSGGTHVYWIPPATGATAYTWTLPAGWSGGSTTDTMTAYPGPNSGNITVTAINGCGASLPKTLSVTVTTGPNAGIWAASNSFCAGTSLLLNATAGSGYTYQWKLNNVNISGATSATYAATQPGSYTVVISNANCSSLSGSYIVTVLPLPAVAVTLVGNVLNATPGFNTYQWYYNSVLIPGATSNTYTPTQSGLYYVIVTNSNNCSNQSNVYGLTLSVAETPGNRQVLIYPSPVQSSFTLESVEKGLLSIIDLQGRRIASYRVGKGTNALNFPNNATAGMYIAAFTSENLDKPVSVRIEYRP